MENNLYIRWKSKADRLKRPAYFSPLYTLGGITDGGIYFPLLHVFSDRKPLPWDRSWAYMTIIAWCHFLLKTIFLLPGGEKEIMAFIAKLKGAKGKLFFHLIVLSGLCSRPWCCPLCWWNWHCDCHRDYWPSQGTLACGSLYVKCIFKPSLSIQMIRINLPLYGWNGL